MKKTGIMTDSHSGILQSEADELGIGVLPMPFYIDEKLYREGVDISREEFYDRLRKGVDVSTSQPSPEEVMKMWDTMLEQYEELVYIPISSGLSGSCMTAQAMAQDEPYAGKVFVVDNGRVSTPMHRSVLDAVELAGKGYSAEKIKKILEDNRENMVIYVGLSTVSYLKKGGRITPAAAAQKLLREYGVRLVYVTMGPRGCYFANRNGSGTTACPTGIHVVDTTGAGDIFGGSAMSQMLKLNKAPEALSAEEMSAITRFACCAASLSTRRHGGINSIPEEQEVLELMRQG